LLEQFPEEADRLKKDAKAKRALHAKQIKQCEKKFPVYGLEAIKDPETLARMERLGLLTKANNAQQNGEGNNDYQGDSLPMFDNIETDFNRENMTPEMAQELQNFLNSKTDAQDRQFNKSADYTANACQLLTYIKSKSKNSLGPELKALLRQLEDLKKQHPLEQQGGGGNKHASPSRYPAKQANRAADGL
jgi:hypothetical protein